MIVRGATTDDIEAVATIWHDGWHDAHAALMPELIPMRSLESFRRRLPALLPETRVADTDGRVSGLCILNADELYQLYVAAASRGTGVAQALMTDAEQRLKQNGIDVAWLACAIGNERAARFYAKSGWTRARVVTYEAETEHGPFRAEVWRYEKQL